MVKVRGRDDVRRYFKQLPEDIQGKLLVGAARAGGKVIRDEAKQQANSEIVREALKLTVRRDGDRIIARVGISKGGPSKGWALALGVWAEYGTDPHYITVDDSQRQGMSANRINTLKKRDNVLVINGQPVGKTVLHPGAERKPFLRVALDTKEGEAVAAAQTYINSRVRTGGIVADPEGADE